MSSPYYFLPLFLNPNDLQRIQYLQALALSAMSGGRSHSLSRDAAPLRLQQPNYSASQFLSPNQIPGMAVSNGMPGQPPVLQTPHLTLEAALQNANNDPMAALETVLNERNMLSTQNAQLWKLIEKQRSGYASVLRELERVRAERDIARGRRGTAPVSSEAEHQTTKQRPVPPRHFSDDTSATSQERSLNGPSLTHTRSLDPLRSDSAPSSTSSHKHTQSQSDTLPSLPSKSPAPSEPTPTAPRPPSPVNVPAPPPTQMPAVQPLFINKDKAPTLNGNSLAARPGSSSSSRSNPSVSIPQSYNSSLRSSAASSPQRTSPLLTSNPAPTAPPPQALPPIPIAAPAPPPAPQPIPPPTIIAPNPAPAPKPAPAPVPARTFNLSATQAYNKVSRESTISLPPEARNYIAHMDDSPAPSPRLQTPDRTSPVKPSSDADYSVEPSPQKESLFSNEFSSFSQTSMSGQPSRSVSPPSQYPSIGGSKEGEYTRSPTTPRAPEVDSPAGTSPFVDMDEESDSEESDDDAQQIIAPPEPYETDRQTVSESSDREDNYSSRRQQQPPPSFPTPQTAQSTSSYQSSQSVQPNGAASRSTTDLYSTSSSSKSYRLSKMELTLTRLKVLSSTIRPNDRGKEVWSFIISVEPRGRVAWRIEKLYSSITNLDTRVRNMLNKSQLKKIAALPESKLFKDNAPAKVDQRKAVLEHYLQSVIIAPVKDTAYICDWFCNDVQDEAKAPVSQVGYKEGYLTKRGKNFGGWKTRYFVLQGPILEYYENRGGAHLGSINVAGAQIGRQQKNMTRDSDDENEYRHAFLIIEAKRGPGGQHNRHVLCAESDIERDSWVDVLVKYVMGSYDDSATAVSAPNTAVSLTSVSTPRSSVDAHAPRRSTKSMKDDISRGQAMPISQLPQEMHHSKLFQAAPTPSDLSMNAPSPVERYPQTDLHRRAVERSQMATNGASDPTGLSSSLPSNSSMDSAAQYLSQSQTQRSTSEIGHYPDHDDPRGSGQIANDRPRVPQRPNRASFMPSLTPVQASPASVALSDRPSTPENNQQSSQPVNGTPMTNGRMADFPAPKPKISGPSGGTVIPAGFKFKDQPSNVEQRDQKSRTNAFWRFGRDKITAAPTRGYASAAVFGVTLGDALATSSIANLPSIVFRCIQYLESKNAQQEEGIYRLSGSSAVIKNLKDRFNQEGDVDMLTNDENWDPHAVAGLLKSFLRELPGSLLTQSLHLRFLQVMEIQDLDERLDELSALVAKLPFENYSLLRALTSHLIIVVDNAAINKMTVRNVGIVFSPTLGIPAGVFSLMLTEFNKVFGVESDGSDAEDAPVEKPPQPRPHRRTAGGDRRNSRGYNESDADRLLGLGGRKLTAPAPQESHSDLDEEIGIYEEEAEGTEYDKVPTLDSHSQGTQGTQDSSSPDTPYDSLLPIGDSDNTATPQRPTRANARITGIAAGKGLQVDSDVKPSMRLSRQPGVVGLPHSPRPHHASSQNSLPSPRAETSRPQNSLSTSAATSSLPGERPAVQEVI